MNGQNSSGVNNAVQWETVRDAAEGAFTLQMPHGWQNEARTVRVDNSPRTLITANRPDGGAFLFAGDANLPMFTEPSALPWGMTLPNTHPYATADAFFTHYVGERYGRMPGFRITSMERDIEGEQKIYANMQKMGAQARVSAAIISFEYQHDNKTVRARFRGNTVSFGMSWLPDVSGVMTHSEDPIALEALLKHMGDSYQTNAQWRQMQNNMHQQTMAQNQTNHQQTMATMQAGHQARMNDIAQAGAANTRTHNDRMAQSTASHQSFMNGFNTPAPASGMSQSDINHERFTDYITGSETVVAPDGEAYKVETGADRYYVNQTDGTYIGTDAFTEQADLGKTHGVNPDNYDETQFRR